MNIALVVVTHNRLEYTKKCLARLLEDRSEAFELYLWDNASSDETPAYLKDGVQDPRIVEVTLSAENLGPLHALNHVWTRTSAELVGKVDNDCLVTPGWTRTLAQAHEHIARLGAIACWHYPLDEFDERAARRAGKLQHFNDHQLLRHPWVCGSGFLMKRQTFQRYGPWRTGPQAGTTPYFLRMALAGEINGWHYPLVAQEHMDDPRSAHCLATDDEALRQMYDTAYTLRTHGLSTMRRRWARRAIVLRNLNRGSWRAECYVGWRARIRCLREKISMYLPGGLAPPERRPAGPI